MTRLLVALVATLIASAPVCALGILGYYWTTNGQ